MAYSALCSWLRSIGFFAILIVFLSGCGREEGVLLVEGEVLSVDPVRELIVLRHPPVDALPATGETSFQVEPVYARWAQAGMRIRGEVFFPEEGSPALQRIWPADRNAEQALAAHNRRLQQDNIIHGQGSFREIGERVSGFALYNEQGRLVTPDDWKDDRVLINFIFTRCMDATMCPQATRLMRETQVLAQEKGVENLRFLSVTLDPEYDTPAILYDYARAYQIDLDNFSFLTGPDAAIRDLMLQLGLLRERDEREVWRHSVATVLLDTDRKVLHRTTSKSWSPSEMIAWLGESAGSDPGI